MIHKTICSIISIAMLLQVSTATVKTSGKHEYKAIRITQEIYNQANTDLSDLRIINEDKEIVPYFINSFESIKKDMVSTTYPLVFVDSFVKKNDSFADYYVEKKEETDLLSTSITVETQSTVFAKTIELSGSFDGVNWEFIQNDKLYRVDNNEKLSIDFIKPLKYNYFRFKILDNIEKIKFDNVYLEYNQTLVEQSFFNENITPEFKVEGIDKTTVINILGLKNIRLNQITINSDDQFKREFKFGANGSKTLYNLNFENTVYQDMIMDFNGYKNNEDILKIRIYNGDDKPINIKNISVSYFADELVFKGDNNAVYTLSFGDDTITSPPIYDISNYKELILKEGYDLLKIDNIEIGKAVEEIPETDYSMLFNGVVIGVSILIGFIILLRFKKIHS